MKTRKYHKVASCLLQSNDAAVSQIIPRWEGVACWARRVVISKLFAICTNLEKNIENNKENLVVSN